MELAAWYEGEKGGRVLIWNDEDGIITIRGEFNGYIFHAWRMMDTVLLDFSMDELAASYAWSIGIKLTQKSYERSQERAAFATDEAN